MKKGQLMNIEKVGVVGCGIMGAGIAQVCAQAGYRVAAMEVKADVLQEGIRRIDAFLAKGVARGKVDDKTRQTVMSRIEGTTSLSNLKDCDLVIEAVNENIELKHNIFSKLEKVCADEAILATNTSSLSIIDIASATSKAERVIGLHFFNPVPLMKLVEIVPSLLTDTDLVEWAKDFTQTLGKEWIVAKDSPGFIVNYLQFPFRLNAIRMLESGLSTKEDIDKAATLGLGHPMGPLALQDLVGLDVTYAGAMEVYRETRDPNFHPPLLMKKMIAAGWLGRKTGKGFYEYSD
jgi:3-hydroxybutyryl-CoA dehydrogenase